MPFILSLLVAALPCTGPDFPGLRLGDPTGVRLDPQVAHGRPLSGLPGLALAAPLQRIVNPGDHMDRGPATAPAVRRHRER
jgi:hypothetical protein